MPKLRQKSRGQSLENIPAIVSSPYFKNPKQKEELAYKAYGKSICTKSHGIQERMGKDFFHQKCLDFAKSLLGKKIVHKVGGKRLSGLVTETECYLGAEDGASHSYKGKKTRRNEPMFMVPGTAYVYFIYGMYYCFNISTEEKGSCVLIRALEPLEGVEQMESNRQQRRKPHSPPLKIIQLCNGPSKLCQAMNITKETCNKVYMVDSESFWVEDGVDVEMTDIVTSTRIGIESAGEESANKPLRFYILGNSCVSVRDKKAEEEILKQNEDR